MTTPSPSASWFDSREAPCLTSIELAHIVVHLARVWYNCDMFPQTLTPDELSALIEKTAPRRGWDFSRMRTKRQPVPWSYPDVVRAYLQRSDRVLDIGTGGGERLIEISTHFGSGVGVDADPEMVKIATENAQDIPNITFHQDDHRLNKTPEEFDVILCRHAPYEVDALHSHLPQGGLFITQQVGEENMSNVKRTIGQAAEAPVLSLDDFERKGFQPLATMEYNVEYVVEDVESLVFWLQALDMFHADLHGRTLLTDLGTFNRMLDGNVDERGFVTNEHRYMIVAQKKTS